MEDEIKKQTPVNETEMAAAKQTIVDAKQGILDALGTCQKISVDTVLDKFLNQVIGGADFDDTDLVTYTVIMHGTVKGLPYLV